jgi:hypothetical protein
MRHVLKICVIVCIGFFFIAMPVIASVPVVDQTYTSEPLPFSGFWYTTMGFLAIGTVITLRAKDATGTKKVIALDTEKSLEFQEGIDTYADLKAEEVAVPLRTQLKVAEGQRDGYRDIIVGEILRIKRLAAPKDKDGKDTFDLEAEKSYLEGLPAERLRMEFDRLPVKREDLKVETVTTGDSPSDPDDPYKAAGAYN